eukprot:TRINITY_DN53287_c1_g1_i1.p3 TRINITY_DN53287_c1_g1~~TRINITY_DN53287_c1_g1_i1.p3  ORF type:complete len:174 (+),score=39.39 TRINITY_DN53287_c1_g1_i1:516-1037(+)
MLQQSQQCSLSNSLVAYKVVSPAPSTPLLQPQFLTSETQQQDQQQQQQQQQQIMQIAEEKEQQQTLQHQHVWTAEANGDNGERIMSLLENTVGGQEMQVVNNQTDVEQQQASSVSMNAQIQIDVQQALGALMSVRIFVNNYSDRFQEESKRQLETIATVMGQIGEEQIRPRQN